jgi:hypothetical protein
MLSELPCNKKYGGNLGYVLDAIAYQRERLFVFASYLTPTFKYFRGPLTTVIEDRRM